METSRQQPSGPQVFPLIIDKTGVFGGNFFDIPVALPFPCNTFFIASVQSGDEANSIIMYFNALNYPRGFPMTTLNGNEQIFWLTSFDAIGPLYRTVIRFKEKITNFFVAIGSENGHLSRYCIFCTNDDELSVRGGIYT